MVGLRDAPKFLNMLDVGSATAELNLVGPRALILKHMA